MDKKNIIDYYGDLEHIIDLKCELLLFNCETDSPLYNSLNKSRDQLISAIQNVCNQSLSNNHSIYGFLLMPEERHILAKFIITNKKISHNVQTSLSLDRENCLDSYEKIEFYLLKCLIDQRSQDENVIDLSDNLKNTLYELTIQVDHFEGNICQAFEIINKQKIKSLCLSRLKSVEENQLSELVSQLVSLEELTLGFYKQFQLNFEQINQLQKSRAFNFNLSIDNVKNMDIQSLGQIDKIDQLRIQESNLFKLNKLESNFTNVKYLCLNWNNIEHVSEDTFSALSDLIALDIGGNEITNLNEKLFENLKNLQFLNLRHNYINEIDTRCFNFAENLEFLSLINGYYDGHDELVVDFDSLCLPKLKYLAIRCNQIPILKNLTLDFLEVKGLRDKALENLRFQSRLKGLILVFSYETNYMPEIDKDVFKNLSHLVYLVFRFDYIFDAQHVVENQHVYKDLVRQADQMSFPISIVYLYLFWIKFFIKARIDKFLQRILCFKFSIILSLLVNK
ncbi:toll-like receptor 5 [Brachionus plicatilis]|uniref:Toll-like receptor 5 n=1 Tax=Brachionus plicatilis TaxID=10195 RepID=A0A3M7RWN7_BRAPC|nr:toll-like receptor 5 [Brachionus plicatilis]